MEAPCIFYTANSSATGMDNLNIILNRGFLFFWSLTFKSYSIFILIYTVNSYLPKVLLQMCKKCICPTEGVYVVITYWLHPPGQCVRTCINITHYINIMKTSGWPWSPQQTENVTTATGLSSWIESLVNLLMCFWPFPSVLGYYAAFHRRQYGWFRLVKLHINHSLLDKSDKWT